MRHLLLPATDTGVAVEAAVTAVVLGAGLLATWRHTELRILMIGVTVAVFAFFALRIVH